MTTQTIGLGSWVVHPEHGFAQVWDVWAPDDNDPEVPDEDDDRVIIATGTECFEVRRDTLTLAEMGDVA